MNSIRTKMIVHVVMPTFVVYVVILGLTLVFLRQRSLRELELTMTRLAANYAGRFDGFLREAAAVAETTARALELNPQPPEKNLYSQLASNVRHAPFVYGAATAFEPGTYPSNSRLFSPYVHRLGEGLNELNITEEVYDWYNDPQWTWFREPKARGRGVWSPPYFDEGAGNILMTTYSAPFRVSGEFRGVTTIDIDLPGLRQTIGRLISEGLDFVVLTAKGEFVYDPRPERIMKKTVHEVAREANNAELEAAIPRLLSGKPGVVDVPGWDTPEREWVFFAPIVTCGWVFVARMPEQEALAGVHQRMVVAAGALGTTLALIIAAIVIVAGRITRPLVKLTGKVDEIANGNLDARAEGIESADEVGKLAKSFNSMADQLRSHIERLASEEASRRKIEHDLSIARGIQQGLLPIHKPKIPGYEIAGWSLPADQTGGDYYDWQTLPGGNTVVTVADVTGHGIGPALVTAVCRAYARASFPALEELGRVLDRINELLVEDLQAGRFVTFVAAILEPRSHTLHMLSAGHGPLFLYRAATDAVEAFPADNVPFGIMPGVGYGPASRLDLAPGDALVLLTDGFFEWANPAGDLFGTDRLIETIREAKNLPPEGMIDHMHQSVLRFAQGSKQLDDLTAVVLKRTMPE